MTLSEKLSDRDSQGPTRDGNNGLSLEYSSTKEGNSSLNPDLFVNPIIPSVVNPFSLSTAKAMDAVKPNHNKANKYLEKNNARALELHRKGNAQEQHPDIAPSVFQSKSSKKVTDERRASALKHQYPGIAGVGSSITKKRRHKVLAQHKAKFPDVTSKTSAHPKKPKLARASAGSALPAKQKKIPKSPPLPHVREDRLAKFAGNLGGASNENPITID